MSDPLATVATDADQANAEVTSKLDTLAADAKGMLAHGEALIAPAVTDFKTLVANRVGDVLIAGIVIVSIFIGHAIH